MTDSDPSQLIARGSFRTTKRFDTTIGPERCMVCEIRRSRLGIGQAWAKFGAGVEFGFHVLQYPGQVGPKSG